MPGMPDARVAQGHAHRSTLPLRQVRISSGRRQLAGSLMPSIGNRVAHYLVLDKLGSGGMGDVYLAEDTKLNRQVALKCLRPEMAEARDSRARFLREARAAAALNHPNIVHLYSVEEAGDLVFITMELVQGHSLRQLLRDGAGLSLAKTISFAIQMADGLASAHAGGIVHRDLKPGNVMITDDERVKILDFGVAKFVAPIATPDPERPTTTEDETGAGRAVGTAGYMSPEQALGRALDARTDLFALGVVLFEMATGRAPFQGDTAAAVFDHLLNRPQPPLLTLKPTLPKSLEVIIDKALEKDPNRRYRSAAEILRDLRAVDVSTAPLVNAAEAATTRSLSSSIAVLPFVDLSPGKDQEYFCHGITEEIINALTGVHGMSVISRTSAFAFQGKDLEVTEIGKRLRVGTVLEGSVRKAGDRVRITAQLVNADDGYQIWSKRFERQLSDVFAIQDEIAAGILDEFRLRRETPQPRGSLNVPAHDAYLRGMYALNKWTDAAARLAIVDFNDAIAQDPDFAPPYAALAEAHIWRYSSLGIMPARETVPHARSAIERALALDPGLAHAYKVRGLIAMNHDWDRSRAEQALTRALQLGPGSASTHLWNAWRLALLERRHDLALIELEQAERLDPLDLQVKTQIGYVHHFRHDLDRAIAQFEKVAALEPSFAFAHYALGDAFTERGEYERAIEAFNKAIELGGRSVNHIGVLGYVYGRSGNRDRANAHLQELQARSADGYVSPMWFALVHLGLSDLDSVFDWLNRGFEERDGSLILIAAAVEFDRVREDSRFNALLDRMGLGHLASSSV
jgi:serine/threonine protein kinase/cytochrome c-type biogenesis protein CcmH/NrfG